MLIYISHNLNQVKKNKKNIYDFVISHSIKKDHSLLIWTVIFSVHHELLNRSTYLMYKEMLSIEIHFLLNNNSKMLHELLYQ